jgi:hypothetical protein
LNELVARLCAAARGLHGTCEALAPSPHSSSARTARARTAEAIELAERHGWGEEPLAGVACTQLSIVMLNQGRLDEAEPWLERALRTEAEPGAGMGLRYARAVLGLARGRPQEALAAFRGAEKLAAALVGAHTCMTSMRSRIPQTLVRLPATRWAARPPPGVSWNGRWKITEPTGILVPLLLDPVPVLLERHRRLAGRSRCSTARSACCATCRPT